jgi:uncharacterized OB-fold protein
MSKPVPVVTEINRLYFEGCAQGELRVRCCLRCAARFRFAHAWCPRCWSQELDFVVASGRGKVTNFCVVHQAPYPAFEESVPYVLALVELEEGVRMMSNVIDCPPERVSIGLEVRVKFEPRGAVSLPMFVPDREDLGVMPGGT